MNGRTRKRRQQPEKERGESVIARERRETGKRRRGIRMDIYTIL